MKKGLKKQIETELMEAIEKVLSNHNKKALAKTTKVLRNASKTLAKKFNKAVKALGEKKNDVVKAEKAKKKLPKKGKDSESAGKKLPKKK